jgi:hypothetical protein
MFPMHDSVYYIYIILTGLNLRDQDRLVLSVCKINIYICMIMPFNNKNKVKLGIWNFEFTNQ